MNDQTPDVTYVKNHEEGQPSPQQHATPPVVMAVWRHPGFIALTGGAIASVIALLTVTFALVISIQARDDLQAELSCRNMTAVDFDTAQAKQAVSNGITLAHLQNALRSFAQDDDGEFLMILETFIKDEARLIETSQAIDAAIEARTESLIHCQP